MALVMLPSDLPWWSAVDKSLLAIEESDEVDMIFEHMQKIHDLCNVSLDPDDDKKDLTFLDGLKNYIKNDLDSEGKTFLHNSIKIVAKYARKVKNLRPPRGLSFSLQQQADCTEINRYFAAALLANAFFSTFPKRTEKTHPTLQDFNFTNFFRTLNCKSQKAKLDCFLYYFDWLNKQETESFLQDRILISRKVMPGKQWLTIEDWLECNFPLSRIELKHQGRIENSLSGTVQAVFTASRIGGKTLRNGNSQECVQFFTNPEALVCLLFVEALEDNEALLIDDVHQIATIMDPKNKANIDVLATPRKISLCCFDAENYLVLPVNQFEEDNILRELNKCLLAFRQNTKCRIVENRENRNLRKSNNTRLSPIGESGSSSPNDMTTTTTATTTIIVNQPSTTSSHSHSEVSNLGEQQIKQWLTPKGFVKSPVLSNPTGVERRGRFIVLGSSGERLPVNRQSSSLSRSSNNNNRLSNACSSCDSDEEFLSARESFDSDEDDDGNAFAYISKELDSPEKRNSFVKKLHEALKQSSNYTESTDDASSYAVGISIPGSRDDEDALRLKRGGSTGFVLTNEDCLDEEFYKNSLEQEKQWLDKFRNKQAGCIQRKDTNDSSKYSFSTECNSELEEVLEKFSKWLDDPEEKDDVAEKFSDPRNEAVLNFANSLLKRTLSESFVGVPLTDGCATSIGSSAEDALIQEYKSTNSKNTTPPLNAKSLSLELAKFRHQIANNRPNQLNNPKRNRNGDLHAVATGNWGCGSARRGDVQLKMIIQWLAASVADLPVLVYYTSGHPLLAKLDTVLRVLRDRQWTVGQLTAEALKFSKENIENSSNSPAFTTNSRDFFENLIGI